MRILLHNLAKPLDIVGDFGVEVVVRCLYTEGSFPGSPRK